MEELGAALLRIGQALSPDTTIGRGCSTAFIGLLLLFLRFRPEIGELLGRTVYLRLFGLEIVAQPRQPAKTTGESGHPDEDSTISDRAGS